MMAAESPRESEASYRSADVIVAGCGIGGLSAALAALEGGAAVAILERAPFAERGGNTRYSEGLLRMKSESDLADDFTERLIDQRGTYLDPSLVALAAKPYGKWPGILKSLSFPDPELVATFADESVPTVAWLRRHGVTFQRLPTPFISQSSPRISVVGGGAELITRLAVAIEALGGNFYYEHTATALVRDSHGSVNGLLARNREGELVRFGGGPVVLATGGFEGNPEMQAAYLGPKAARLRPVVQGGYYNRGEGIRMALDVGAAPGGDYSQYHAEPIDPRSGAPEPAIFSYPYGIVVNAVGVRFLDEGIGTADATYEDVARAIADQPDGIAYLVVDSSFMDLPRREAATRTDQPAITGNSLAELAAKLELPLRQFALTVDEYNAACPEGRFDPLRVDGLRTDGGAYPPKSNWARPLTAPPFYAYPLISANVFTFGGLRVSSSGGVVDTDGREIGGLFAAGETVGLYQRSYVGATSLLKGAVFGRLAGATAASRASSL